MKPNSKNIHVLLRGREAGSITRADIERRARENALIRTGSEHYTAVDLQEAMHELFGDDSPAAMTEDAPAEIVTSRDPTDPAVDLGHQRAGYSLDKDEENEEAERLVIQGVEEAQHDLMVRARQQEKKHGIDERI